MQVFANACPRAASRWGAGRLILAAGVAWGLLVAANTPAAESILLSARELRERHETIVVPSTGEYHVYIWAAGGEAIAVGLGDKKVGEVGFQADAPTFAWAGAGTTALEAGKPYLLRLGTDAAATAKALESRVGFVLLSTTPGDPSRLFETARIYPREAKAVDDPRVTEFRHKDMTYPARKYDSKEQWKDRADFIRKQILVATGLWPMPERTPLNAKRFGRIDRDGYSIEKVYFESFPGFYATGNLYLPRGRKPPYPAILCPHGHWGAGRLANEESGSVPGRCISLARQGCVVFSIDMVGYNDSRQVKHRNEFIHPLWGLSLMGLQLWNGIRAIDFLLTIDGVDPGQIGCTGASGGGTQTFILTAVDDRIKVAVPVCMVSAHFQGGCQCENAPLLRLDAYNVEIAAAAAPRPYMLTGATGDWTKNVMTVEGPRVKDIYRLFGAEDKFHHVIVDAGHNYNKETREHVYAWMGRWLLGETDAEKFREQPFELEKREDVLVFSDAHPLPNEALTADGVRDYLIERTKKQIESLKPKDAEGHKRFRDVYATALTHALIGRPLGQFQADAQELGQTESGRWKITKLLLTQPGVGNRVPAVLWEPKDGKAERLAVVVHPEGKMGLLNPATGEPGPLPAAMLEAGYIVLSPDCFLTGEFHSPFAETKRALPKEFADTYNPTTLAWRMQDVATALMYMEQRTNSSEIDLVGVGEAGPWCLLVAAIGSPPEKVRVVIDANGFADSAESSWQGDMFQPSILALGGLRVAGALSAPTALMIHNTQGKLDTAWIGDVYRAVGAGDAFRALEGHASVESIIQWLGRSSDAAEK